MQLVNDNNDAELVAVKATNADAVTIAKMVDNMNRSLKDDGYAYRYITYLIGDRIYIRQLV